MIELSRVTDQEEILSKLGTLTVEKVGGSMIHVRSGIIRTAFYFPDGRTMVIGSADQVRKIIKRDCTAKFSEPLANAVGDHLDVSQTIAMAVAMPKVLPAALAKTPFNLEILKGVQTVTIHGETASDLRLSAALICKEDKIAEQFQKIAEGMVALGMPNRTCPN